MLKNSKFQPQAQKILKDMGRFADELGVSVYLVGGAVRDALLGKDPSEMDFVVLGNGVEFAEKAYSKYGGHGLVRFERFGTASFFLADRKLEFVSARKEMYEKGSRKPHVASASLEEDLARRDFTINAMAMGIQEPHFGEIIDPFDGQKDLQLKMIRTPLNPFHTFSEDPLRILRAARFASQLQFDIAPETLQAMKEERERLRIVSQERITDELLKILSHPKPSTGFRILQQTGVLELIFPELASLSGVEQRNSYHHKDVFEHTLKVVDNIAKVSDKLQLRFAGLVHDIGKPVVKRFIEGVGWTFYNHENIGERMLKRICTRLKLPNEYLKYSQKLTRLHMRPIQLIGGHVTDSAIRRILVQAGEDIEDLMILCRADITSGNPKRVQTHLANFDWVVQRMKEVEERDRLRAFQSPVRGDEIMAVCGLKPGPLVGKLKSKIEEAILEGEIPNEHDAALEYLLKIKEEIIHAFSNETKKGEIPNGEEKDPV